ncbi:CDGSH iron-sulfur domain-containing protein [Cochlodiniinecator piscidefendens]|uniref:CDGSH iron-sulfur domain-containing protein n=1 Tax=Cochlodiniinecator piscidefendens TaxID=2715756 RepID=UPI001407A3C3|nr:CDGSH iron-sulfur domain-containing protein [Cochlodiniinecator piscidefendens]
MSDDKPIFELRENGPLILKHCASMKGADGDVTLVKPVMALCRCGASKSKPFCDGTHKDIGFLSSGGKPAGRDRLIAYEGAEVTVTYNPLLCSHAAECGRLASHVFDPAQKPWIQPDNGTKAEVEAVVAACPSGALAFAGAEHRIAERTTVEVEPNGPYWVTGAAIDAPLSGEGGSADKYVLCRCGRSGNKPYCDGTHRDEGWRSED